MSYEDVYQGSQPIAPQVRRQPQPFPVVTEEFCECGLRREVHEPPYNLVNHPYRPVLRRAPSHPSQYPPHYPPVRIQPHYPPPPSHPHPHPHPHPQPRHYPIQEEKRVRRMPPPRREPLPNNLDHLTPPKESQREEFEPSSITDTRNDHFKPAPPKLEKFEHAPQAFNPYMTMETSLYHGKTADDFKAERSNHKISRDDRIESGGNFVAYSHDHSYGYDNHDYDPNSFQDMESTRKGMGKIAPKSEAHMQDKSKNYMRYSQGHEDYQTYLSAYDNALIDTEESQKPK